MIGNTPMDSHAARMASFNAAHSVKKKRASDSKGAKSLRWPHKSPSPLQLANAGFFYHPSASNPDNVACYLCRSNLDGWEENDDPIEEHLTHSPSCGWANAAAIEQAVENGNKDLENPMSEHLVNARSMTFGSTWPHESKRGWVCKTQKMVEAGWHYCPTLESDDYARCAYCNLSLDGWEPKDNPYDEHIRRSPDCMFFALSAVQKLAKTGKAKKSRASKASRMSTQSTFSVASEDPSIVESDPHNDSVMSVAEPAKPTRSGKGGKKGGKSKAKDLGPKQDDIQLASSFIEPEDDDFEVKVSQPPASRAKGKKRDSEDMAGAAEAASTSGPDTKKRRTTRTRNSVANLQAPPEICAQDDAIEQIQDIQMTDAENMPPPSKIVSKKGGKGRKTRGSSNTRKASTTSTASKASLRAGIPNDEEIDAALEEDLDRPLTDDGGDDEEEEVKAPKGRRLTRSKNGSKASAASTAPTRRTTRTSAITIDESAADMYPVNSGLHKSFGQNADDAEEAEPEPQPLPNPKTGRKKTTRKVSAKEKAKEAQSKLEEPVAIAEEETEPAKPKQTRTRQPSRQIPSHAGRPSNASTSQTDVDMVSNVDSSMFDMQTAEDDSGHETDASVATKEYPKRGGRKASTAKKTRGGKKAGLHSHNIEDVVQPAMEEVPAAEDDGEAEAAAIETKELEPAAKEAKKPRKQTKAAKAGMKPTRAKNIAHKIQVNEQEAPVVRASEPKESVNAPDAPSSPPAVSFHATPQQPPSPQSSDVENQPPSSRPSQSRPPLSFESAIVLQDVRVPLAVITTPVASPSKGNFSKLQSTFPWTAMDIDQVFHGTPNAEKENGAFASGARALTSPEKKLTVEEWIKFNAQRGEEKLRNDCERLVGRFEGEGVRALRTLEGIVCVD